MAPRDLPRPQLSSLIQAALTGRHQRIAARRGLRSRPRGDRRSRHTPFPLLAGLVLALVAPSARAQAPSPNQPLAIDGMPPPPCPLLVPAIDSALQPLRIQPSQVARKNAVGCLSPADAALYGPDGCPLKLCHSPQGTVPLPGF